MVSMIDRLAWPCAKNETMHAHGLTIDARERIHATPVAEQFPFVGQQYWCVRIVYERDAVCYRNLNQTRPPGRSAGFCVSGKRRLSPSSLAEWCKGIAVFWKCKRPRGAAFGE